MPANGRMPANGIARRHPLQVPAVPADYFFRGAMSVDVMDLIEASQLRDDIPKFDVGDTVNVHVRVVEGEKERIQQFQGVVIAFGGAGARRTFTVRKISSSVGVERIFPLYSPKLATIDVVRHGSVRQSKLYYLRDLRGKAARIREKRYEDRS